MSQTAAENKTEQDTLDQLLDRVNLLVAKSPAELAPSDEPGAEPTASNSLSDGPAEADGEFTPIEPNNLLQAGLTDSQIESLVLKLLNARGDLCGRDIATHIKLPFMMVDAILTQLKQYQLVVYRCTAPMNDYIYQLTDLGRERARRCSSDCSYFGAAPVPLCDYIASVKAQSIESQHPTAEDLERAFSDLLINPRMLARLGPAINSGRGMFLFGYPGNGKTSIAERVTRSFGQFIWIPRALGVDGEIIRLFDPINHEESPPDPPSGIYDMSRIDKRWVRIRRPTIIAGGELTMDNLEVSLNKSTGISEAPLQLKSNCGTLVIDDFGRQRMSVDELLNRWIVPLEKRYDFLNLSNGKKVQVPFDQLIVFSTNLEPKDLVDDAFLRRIPYKIEVEDPSEADFRELFKIMCRVMKLPYDQAAVDYLIEHHYKKVGRPYRCCQPRDLLLQVKNYCRYQNVPVELTPEYFDFAVSNYFAML